MKDLTNSKVKIGITLGGLITMILVVISGVLAYAQIATDIQLHNERLQVHAKQIAGLEKAIEASMNNQASIIASVHRVELVVKEIETTVKGVKYR